MAEMKHQIPIKAAPEKVYAAITTQAGLRGWWTADTKADEKPAARRSSVSTNGAWSFA
jgi:uncharacterized protein YndB with AHSA1/START domain